MNGLSGDAVTGYWLRMWAAGELDASDTLDRVREAGGHITATQYAMMRRVDETGTPDAVLLPYAEVEASQWDRAGMSEWAGIG